MTTRRITLPGRSTPRRRRRIVESVLIVVSFMLLLDALFGERGVVEMVAKDQQYRDAQAELDRTYAENARLREENARLRQEDPATIEDAARRDLGMIKPGERVIDFRDVPTTEP